MHMNRGLPGRGGRQGMSRLTRIGSGVVAIVAVGAALHALTARAKTKPHGPPAAVPVLATVVKAQAVPDDIEGLGTVQAFNSVAVKSRVDGQITKIFFRQGQEVKAGDPLFQIDPRPYQAALDLALAAKEKDQATLAGAETDLAQYGPLVRQHYTSQKVYQDQKATVAELRAAVKADEASIETARLNLGYALIRAPIGGRTGAYLVDVGNFVQASQNASLVTIAEIRPVYVGFTVPQADLAQIRRNQAAHALAVAAVAGDGRTVLSRGRLSFINNTIDTATGTVSLMGSFVNADEALWPGEFVTARLTIAVQPDALTVPAGAVVEGPNGTYVYVIRPGHTVLRRNVKVARQQDGLDVIAQGLAAGEQVVEDGQFRLVNGARVRIDPPAPGAPAPGAPA